MLLRIPTTDEIRLHHLKAVDVENDGNAVVSDINNIHEEFRLRYWAGRKMLQEAQIIEKDDRSFFERHPVLTEVIYKFSIIGLVYAYFMGIDLDAWCDFHLNTDRIINEQRNQRRPDEKAPPPPEDKIDRGDLATDDDLATKDNKETPKIAPVVNNTPQLKTDIYYDPKTKMQVNVTTNSDGIITTRATAKRKGWESLPILPEELSCRFE